MAFWCRINQSKLKLFSHQLKRYLQNPHASSLNYSTTCSTHYLLENPLSGISGKRTEFFCNVRFFAAPVQTKPKKEERGTSGPRLNEQITAHIVRIVTDEEHHVVSRREALEQARKLNLDLVEVQRNADPPVCKIMDFHKERYKQEVKEKERAKSKAMLKVADCKVIRFYPKCELKDLKMKADMVKRLMERGYRVKCVAKPKGNEDQDLGELLSRLSAMIEDVAVVESGPRVEASQAYIVVRHVKFGPLKKGGGKKSKGATNSSAGVQEGATSATSAVIPDEEDESIVDNETWSVVDSNDDFESVFELKDNMKGASAYPADEMSSAALTASSSTTFNKSNIGHRTPVPNSKANTHPSFPLQPSLETVNRYARSESKNQFPPTKPTDNRIPATRDPYPRRQMPQEMNLRPLVNESRHPGGSSPPFPDFKPSSSDVRKQEPSRPNASDTPRSSYGIFSTPNANAPGNQGPGGDARRNREGSSNDSGRIPGTGGLTPKQSQRPVDDKAGQGRWGIFSREDSAATPARRP